MNIMKILTVLLLLLISVIVFPAKEFDPETDIKITHFVNKADLKEGDQFKVLLSLEVPNDYHITDSDLFYVDTESAPDFDLAHRNRIVWSPDDPDDFRIKLENRIKAVIF